jgi:hypothetical protein
MFSWKRADCQFWSRANGHDCWLISIPTGIAVLLLMLLGLWHFADDGLLPAIALAMLVLALAAFCPDRPEGLDLEPKQ